MSPTAPAALHRVVGRLAGDAVGDLGAFGVLRDRGRHLLDRSAGLLDAGGLLVGRLAQRLRGRTDLFGGRRQRIGGAAHIAQDAAQAQGHVLHRAQQLPGLVLVGHYQVLAQIAGGHAVGGLHCACQRPGDAAGDQHADQHADQGCGGDQGDHLHPRAFVDDADLGVRLAGARLLGSAGLTQQLVDHVGRRDVLRHQRQRFGSNLQVARLLVHPQQLVGHADVGLQRRVDSFHLGAAFLGDEVLARLDQQFAGLFHRRTGGGGRLVALLGGGGEQALAHGAVGHQQLDVGLLQGAQSRPRPTRTCGPTGR